MKDAVDRDISVGGPHLGAPAIVAGLVDEFHLFVAPVVVNGGTPSLPVISTRGLSWSTSRGSPMGWLFPVLRGTLSRVVTVVRHGVDRKASLRR